MLKLWKYKASQINLFLVGCSVLLALLVAAAPVHTVEVMVSSFANTFKEKSLGLGVAGALYITFVFLLTFVRFPELNHRVELARKVALFVGFSIWLFWLVSGARVAVMQPATGLWLSVQILWNAFVQVIASLGVVLFSAAAIERQTMVDLT